MDEVFSGDNFMSLIAFTKGATGLKASNRLATRLDYLVWYAKDADNIKYRQLFTLRNTEIDPSFGWIENQNGERRRLTSEEKSGSVPIQCNVRVFQDVALTKPGPGAKYVIEYQGQQFDPGKRWWGTTKESLQRVIKANKVTDVTQKLSY